MSAAAPKVTGATTRKRSRRKSSIQSAGGALTTMTAHFAHEIWSRGQWFALVWHLHNNNGVYVYVMGWFGPNRKNGGRPEAIYTRAKTLRVGRAIPWAWTSLCGKGRKKIAFVPYAQNSRGESRWGGVDLDAHSDDKHEAEIARARAFAFFQAVLNLKNLHVILEASGRGWHVWLVSKDFRPCAEWSTLLLAKLVECEIPVDECEIFPPESTAANPFGKGMRAPGSWNPTTFESNRILWENVTPLLDELVALNTGPVSLKEKDDSFPSPLSFCTSLYPRLLPLLTEFAIVKPRTRRGLLQKLCGHLFHQVSRCIAEKFARTQFAQKKVKTKADEAEHLKEFGDFWAGLDNLWQGKLSPVEADAFNRLANETERDAFRIIHSYAVFAGTRGQDDFPIVRDDLAARLGITPPGAGELVGRFCHERGLLRRTQEYVPHKRAARYRWLDKSVAAAK